MSVVTVTVRIAGQSAPQEWGLLSVDVRREVGRVPVATLVFIDGDVAEGSFPISDADKFRPGTEVEILARYEGGQSGNDQDRTLFKGLVVRHGIEAGRQGSVLRIDLRDKAITMTRPRRSRVSVKAKDSDVFLTLAKEAGLSAQAEATTVVHPSLVQFDCSDWDWLLTRAEALGQVVVVTDGSLKVTKPPAAGPAAVKLTWGVDILDLDFICDALGQEQAVGVANWDPTSLKLAETQGVRPPAPTQGALRGDKAAQDIGFGKSTRVFPASLQAAEAKDWASAELFRSQWGLQRGRVRVQGLGSIGLLDTVEIAGVAHAHAGKALVTGLCHRIADGNWTTDLQFGLGSQAHHRRPDIASAPAAGLLPPASALQIAVVASVAEDPDGQHRVQVKVPVLGEAAEGLWARLATPDAGPDRGFSFRPEPGDEVVLGFFNDDPRQPVVLGALFGSKNTPPKAVHDATDKNTLRGLVTRSGLTLALDDDKQQLSLLMPSGAKLLMDDDGEAIVLSDKHGNKITMDKNGISLASAKDLKLEASGNVTVKGAKIDLN